MYSNCWTINIWLRIKWMPSFCMKSAFGSEFKTEVGECTAVPLTFNILFCIQWTDSSAVIIWLRISNWSRRLQSCAINILVLHSVKAKLLVRNHYLALNSKLGTWRIYSNAVIIRLCIQTIVGECTVGQKKIRLCFPRKHSYEMYIRLYTQNLSRQMYSCAIKI